MALVEGGGEKIREGRCFQVGAAAFLVFHVLVCVLCVVSVFPEPGLLPCLLMGRVDGM